MSSTWSAENLLVNRIFFSGHANRLLISVVCPNLTLSLVPPSTNPGWRGWGNNNLTLGYLCLQYISYWASDFLNSFTICWFCINAFLGVQILYHQVLRTIILSKLLVCSLLLAFFFSGIIVTFFTFGLTKPSTEILQIWSAQNNTYRGLTIWKVLILQS